MEVFLVFEKILIFSSHMLTFQILHHQEMGLFFIAISKLNYIVSLVILLLSRTVNQHV